MYKYFVKISFIVFFSLNFSIALGMGKSSFKPKSPLFKQYYQNHSKHLLLNLPGDIFFTIFAALDNKNAFQQVSRKAHVRGSKRVPNFYSIAKLPEFIASEEDYTYGMINATYDNERDVINNIRRKTNNQKHEYRLCIDKIPLLCIGINNNKVYFSAKISFINDQGKIQEDTTDNAEPDPLMMACYSGNLGKVKSLLEDNEENNNLEINVLINASAIAKDKGYYDCLQLLIPERNLEAIFLSMLFNDGSTSFVL